MNVLKYICRGGNNASCNGCAQQFTDDQIIQMIYAEIYCITCFDIKFMKCNMCSKSFAFRSIGICTDCLHIKHGELVNKRTAICRYEALS